MSDTGHRNALMQAHGSTRSWRGFAALAVVLLACVVVFAVRRESPPSPTPEAPTAVARSPAASTAALSAPDAVDPNAGRAALQASVPPVHAERGVGALTARVVGRPSGRPRAHAVLSLRPAGRITRDDLVQPQTTDAHGKAHWTDLAPGVWSLATPDGRHLGIEIAAGESRELDVVLDDGVAVSGVVVDPERRPVPHADVHVSHQVLRHLPPASAQADALGRFRIEDVGGVRWICAATPGRVASPWIAIPADRADGADVELEIEIGAEAARLEVSVEDETGRPVAGAWVRVASEPGRLELAGTELRSTAVEIRGRTDAAGRFRTESARPGPAQLEVRARGARSVARSIRLTIDAPAEVLVVVEREARIAGTVHWASGGPVVGATVRRASAPGADPPLAASGADGSFEIDGLGPGAIELRVEDASGASATATFDLRPGDVQRWDCVLASGGTVRGRVVDELGAPRDDLPVVIHVEGGDVDLVTTPTVRSDGSFEARVARGRTYAVEVRGDRGALDPLAFIEHVEPDGHEIVVAVPRPRHQSWIVGSVTDAGGRPVPMLSVVGASADPATALSATCDAGGRFRCGPLAPGNWKLLAAPAGGQAQVVAHFEAAVSGGEIDLGRLRLHATGSIRASIVGAAGASRADGVIIVVGEDGDPLVARTVRADSWDVSVRVDGLAAGRYVVRFRAERARSDDVAVEVRADRESDVQLLVAP